MWHYASLLFFVTLMAVCDCKCYKSLKEVSCIILFYLLFQGQERTKAYRNTVLFWCVLYFGGKLNKASSSLQLAPIFLSSWLDRQFTSNQIIVFGQCTDRCLLALIGRTRISSHFLSSRKYVFSHYKLYKKCCDQPDSQISVAD